MPLSDLKIPPFRYFPTDLLEKQGPKQWARLRLLQACERLKIPHAEWPPFKGVGLAPEYDQSYGSQIPFFLPDFHGLYETEAEWRERARLSFEAFLDEQTAWTRKLFRGGLNRLTKIRRTRGKVPLELRYEWGAQRYCLKKQYKEMSTDVYTAEQIRKIVTAIFREADLPERT